MMVIGVFLSVGCMQIKLSERSLSGGTADDIETVCLLAGRRWAGQSDFRWRGDLITVNIICVHDYEKTWRIRGSCDML